MHELHQFSGSINEIDVSFPSLCLSNTALSYLCGSLSDFLPHPGMLDVCVLEGMRFKSKEVYLVDKKAAHKIWNRASVRLCYTSAKLTVVCHQ